MKSRRQNLDFCLLPPNWALFSQDCLHLRERLTKVHGLGWGRFCFVRGISIWFAPGTPGWDEPLRDCLIWTSKVLGRKSSTLKGRFAAIRFVRLVSGDVDFTVEAHRGNATIKGLKEREKAFEENSLLTRIFPDGRAKNLYVSQHLAAHVWNPRITSCTELVSSVSFPSYEYLKLKP